MARFLALDWDQKELHLLTATLAGKGATVQRAVVYQEEESPATGDPLVLGAKLRERLREAGVSATAALVCVGRDRVILKDIRYPPVPEAEEAIVVRHQAVKDLADGDMVVDYAPMGATPEGQRRAVAMIVRREVVEAYQKLCQTAGLKLLALTPRPFGLAACIRKVVGTSVLTPAPEPADAPVAVVTVGERWAEFAVVHGDALLLTRSLVAGPNLAQEVRRSLAVHAGQAGQQPVRAVYVAGRGLAELREKLGELSDLPVHPFDPFAGAETVELPAATRGTFAGAAGLLYAWARDGALPINFVRPREPKPPVNNLRPRLLVGVALLLALLLGGVSFGQVLITGYRGERDSLHDSTKALESQHAEAKLTTARLEAMDSWDTAPWLDEWYDLTKRVPDIKAIQITQFKADPYVRPAAKAGAPKAGAKGAASPSYTARLTIVGKMLDKAKSQKAVWELYNLFRQEVQYYTPQTPEFNKDTFTLRVDARRRPPSEYKAVLPPPAKAEAPAKGKTKGKKK